MWGTRSLHDLDLVQPPWSVCLSLHAGLIHLQTVPNCLAAFHQCLCDSPLPRVVLFSGIGCQPKVKDKFTLTCNPGAGPRLGHEMVYRINEGIQYCISLCICLLSVLQVFNDGGSVRKEKRGARASPGGQGSWRKRRVIIRSPQ